MKLPTKLDGTKWEWDSCRFQVGTPQRLFLELNWNNPISEEEYVSFMVSQPKTKVTQNPPSHRRKRYKKEYRYLRSTWGFFRPVGSFL